MTSDVENIVAEARELTGSEGPEVMEDDSPVLAGEALRDAGGDGVYLIGLIGGKEVGKSALVNALVGQEITQSTAYGPGTEIVTAYVHESRAAAMRALLEREVPGKYRVVTHSIARLSRQVLLDLPDIDSRYADHVETTRRMLRHMLYPVWVQSVEKYADRQPQLLLGRVAAGNSPENFVFVLNKVDQVISREGEEAARELRDDYAGRLRRVLSLPEAPRVFAVSALQGGKWDLPALRELLAQQKAIEVVQESKQSAVRQRGVSVLRWLQRQDLPARAERLRRLEEEAEELLDSRVGDPVRRGLAAMAEDPANRAALVDEAMRRRVARWPIVNVLHTLLAPLMTFLRLNFARKPEVVLLGADGLADTYLNADGVGVASRVQTAFAQLQQSHGIVSNLYKRRKLWEPMAAEQAAGSLRRRVAVSIEEQRASVRERLAGASAPAGVVVRGLLTIGALVWFPILQPMLEAMLDPARPVGSKLQGLAFLLVQISGGTYLLKNVSFLLIYFAVLWAVLRWDTQRRVGRLLARWRTAEAEDPMLNPAAQATDWMADLLTEVRQARVRMEGLIAKGEELRKGLESQALAGAA